jgi:hypothetical protein
MKQPCSRLKVWHVGHVASNDEHCFASPDLFDARGVYLQQRNKTLKEEDRDKENCLPDVRPKANRAAGHTAAAEVCLLHAMLLGSNSRSPVQVT